MGHTRNTAENILSTLSPEAAQTLESHFRQQVAQEISGGLAKPAAKAPKAEAKAKPAKRGRKRGGRDKGFSAFIRAYDAEHTVDGEPVKANEVVAAGAEQGLVFSPVHVYNCRAQAKRAAEKVLDEKSEAKRQAEIKAKRAAAAAKAREAKAAKAEAANEKTAAKAKAEAPAPKKTGKRVAKVVKKAGKKTAK
jgi:hypothetical protein